MSLDLSVIVPSYNETADIKKKALEEIDSYLKRQKYSYEVWVMDDESTNGTRDIVREKVKGLKNFKFIASKHAGKAITVMDGLLNSTGKIALFTDMDQATPINQLDKIMHKYAQGFDIVIGSRKGRSGAPISRKIAAWGFATLRNIILGLPFSDTQCGFKAFNRQSINSIFPILLKRWTKMHSKGAAVNAGFDVETLFLAKKRNFKIAEVKVDWHHVGNEKQVQIVKDAIEATSDMLRIRLNDFRNKYSENA